MHRTRFTLSLMLTVALALGVALIGRQFAMAGDGHSHHNHGGSAKAPSAKAKAKTVKSAAYPLDTCPVTGEKLGSMGDPVVYDHKGREIKFCCSGCIDEFKANADKYIAEIDKKIIAKQVKAYPLTTCVVTDEALGSMGDTVDIVYKNRLVRFCCEGCVDEFKSDPAKYLSKIDTAAKSKAAKAKKA
jgi:YHS domain-containing protein